jgi:hypothetical protein
MQWYVLISKSNYEKQVEQIILLYRSGVFLITVAITGNYLMQGKS